MCGIVGFLDCDLAREGDERRVQYMMDALAHRGPDAEGLHVDGPVVLGHRRLSIIDLRPEANQPMANEDGSVQLVVNGEIFNHRELRRDLEARGHAFRSRSDSEVILHLYEERGNDCLRELRGMFAFALWDARARRLLLARDRAGEKPLYYAAHEGRFWFASELPALWRALPFSPSIDLGAIEQYLTLQYVPAPLTAWRGVCKLPAAHSLTVTPGGEPRVSCYWHLRFEPRPHITKDDAVAEARALLEDSVALRQVADVPVGAFLSGGIDSSAVVALMARRSSRPIHTFSIDLPDGDGEASYARLVAARYHTQHHELLVTPELTSILPKLVARWGEPFADSSAVPTYYVSELAGRDVRVVLSGDGGDEAFGGYTRYALEEVARRVAELPAPLPRLARALLERMPGRTLRPVREFGAHQALSPAERYLFFLAHFTRRDKLKLVGPALAPLVDENRVVRDFERILDASDAPDPLNRLLDLDTQTYLPDDIFNKVDIASMAHSIEVRAPLVDHILLEQMAGLPGALKLNRFRGKQLLREAVRDLLPAPILARRKKGFGLPLARWMREDLEPMSRDLLTDATARARGLLDPSAVARLLAECRAGVDHGQRLWNLMALELWLRGFVDQAVPREPLSTPALASGVVA